MREILFRGKRTDNGEWVEGYYYKAKYCRTDDELCDYITVPHPKEYNEPSSHYIVIPETVGQCIGLKDRNGINIFEGDIVEENGELRTTGCQRTGCVFCGFGAHLEKEPTRFQMLKETHPKLYNYCLNGGEYDDEGLWRPTKDGLGMRHVYEELNRMYGDGFIKYE